MSIVEFIFILQLTVYLIMFIAKVWNVMSFGTEKFNMRSTFIVLVIAMIMFLFASQIVMIVDYDGGTWETMIYPELYNFESESLYLLWGMFVIECIFGIVEFMNVKKKGDRFSSNGRE